MSPLKLVLLFTLAVFGKSEYFTTSPNINLISEYFQAKHISRLILYVCWSFEDQVFATKHLSQNEFTVTYPIGLTITDQRIYRRLFNSDYYKLGIVFDMNCINKTTLFSRKSNFFNSSYSWLIFPGRNFNATINYIKSLRLRLDTDMVVANYSDNNILKQLFELYKYDNETDKELIINYMGDWDPEDRSISQKCFSHRKGLMLRLNPRGFSMRMSLLTQHNIKNESLETYFLQEKDPQLDTLFKFTYYLFTQLQETLNFNMEFVISHNFADKNIYGDFKSENIIGMIQNNKADVAGSPLLISDDRLDVLFPLHTTYYFRSGFILIDRNTGGFAKFHFFTPFVTSIWICITVITAVMLVLVLVIKKYEDYNHFPAISDFLLSIWGVWCQVGSPMPLKSMSIKIAFLCFLFTSTIVYNFYTSSILSSLLNYRGNEYTLSDLADSRYKCGAFDEVYIRGVLFDTQNPIIPELKYFNSKKKIDRYYAFVEDGLKRIRNESFAFHIEYNAAYQFIQNYFDSIEICHLKEVNTFPNVGLALWSSKNYQYADVFRVAFVKIREGAVLNRAMRKYFFMKPKCNSNGLFQVSLGEISSYFFVLLMGIIFSSIILCVEIILYYIIKKNRV